MDTIEIITAVTGLLGVIIGGIGIILSYISGQRLLHFQNIEIERKEIYDKLNKFYGPCQQLLATSKSLTDVLKRKKRRGWRTLIALLNGEKFSKNDKVVFEQIIEITDKIEKLRIKNSGLIDDPELINTFALAGAHFRIISAAYSGGLKGEVDRFQDYVYPNQLNEMIDKKIINLQTRLEGLNKGMEERPFLGNLFFQINKAINLD